MEIPFKLYKINGIKRLFSHFTPAKLRRGKIFLKRIFKVFESKGKEKSDSKIIRKDNKRF